MPYTSAAWRKSNREGEMGEMGNASMYVYVREEREGIMAAVRSHISLYISLNMLFIYVCSERGSIRHINSIMLIILLWGGEEVTGGRALVSGEDIYEEKYVYKTYINISLYIYQHNSPHICSQKYIYKSFLSDLYLGEEVMYHRVYVWVDGRICVL